MIEQGCKIQNGLGLSVGAYSLVDPSLWVESASITDGGSYFNNTIPTNRVYETLLFLASKYKFDDKYFTETFGHDGTNNYMRHHLDMNGKSIFDATQLTAITYVYSPTIRTTTIEFWNNDINNAIDYLRIISGAHTFMNFSTAKKYHYKCF